MQVDLRRSQHPLCILALAGSFLAGAPCQGAAQSAAPHAAQKPPAKIDRLKRAFRQDRFVAYTPSEYDPRGGSRRPATEAGIRADLEVLRTRFSALVTYGCSQDDGTALIVPVAAALKLHVVLGIWDVKSVPEIETAVSLARRHPETVIAVIVGNETQLFHRVEWRELEAAIRLVQAALPGVPVSTSEPISDYGDARLRRVVDFHAPNCHWIFQGGNQADVAAAVAWIKNRIQALQDAPGGNKPILIKEHGLPSNPAPFTPELQAQYWKEWLAARPNSEMCTAVFFSFCDLPWLRSETNSASGQEFEAHWGAWDDRRRPKPVVKVLPKRQ